MTDDNNNNIDQLEEAGSFDEAAPFDEFEGGGEGTLGEVFRNNPMAKVGVVVGAFVLLVGGIVLFGGKEERPAQSTVGAGSNVVEAPGTGEVSEAYRQAIEEKNMQNVEEAIRTGTSALPVPVSSPQGRVDLSPIEGEGEDPLERWRRIQEERQRREMQQVPPEQSNVDPNVAAIEALAESMANQMGSVLENTQPREMRHASITEPEFLNRDDDEFGENGQGEGEAEEQILNVIIPAGTVEYAQLLTEANTDAPGPVLAEIASGPLAGSRILGSFQSTEEYLVLSFNQVVIDGISYSVDAIALDPKTTNPGMVTEIDRRYFRRIVLPAASAFIEGVAETIAQTEQSGAVTDGGTVTTEQEEPDSTDALAKGVEKATSQVTEILDEEASRTKVLIRVASGTPMGILFVAPVTKDEAQQ